MESLKGRKSPGGSARLGDPEKAPRRVKWSDNRSTSSSGFSHALDEMGRDPEAFETLRLALEHYRASPLSHEPPSASSPSKAPLTDTFPDLLEAHKNRPVHDAPGHYIDPHESAGLPGITRPEEYAHRQAVDIVHKLTPAKNQHAKRHGRTRANSHTEGKAYVDSDINEGKGGLQVQDAHKQGDIEGNRRTGMGLSQMGVLSSLLAMHRKSGHNSLPSSRPDSDGSEELDSPGARQNKHQRTKSHPHLPHLRLTHPEEEKSAEGVATPTDITPPGPVRTRQLLRRTLSGTSLSKFGKIGSPPSGKTKKGGGVIGSLIASTGNIAGVAAPVHSQLQPNLKRPGYHLTRYSVEQVPTFSHGRNYSLAQSVASSAPGTGASTPASAYSPNRQSVHSPLSRLTAPSLFKEFNRFGLHSGMTTPTEIDEFDEKRLHDYYRRKDKMPKRKKKEVYITRHVAQLLQREEFILKFARAMMMFGGPSHRLTAQLQSTARVLDIELSALYLPDVILISFDDPASGTSHLKFIRQSSSLDLGKLTDAYVIYWKVIHDDVSVSDASIELDTIMRRAQFYKWWQLILLGGMCSSAICSLSFNGSFIDTLVVFPMGAVLVGIQTLSVRNELYSNIFELTMATLFSFVAAALASTHKFCYSAVASSAVVLILPGFIVLCGALEVVSRNMTAGSVRLCYAVMYALFLGFGLAIGAEVYQKISGTLVVGSEDYACTSSHLSDGPWYQKTPSKFWAFLTVPLYATCLSAKNQTPWSRKEMLLLVAIACIGWTTNYFVSLKFRDQRDIVAAVGAFTVGLISNLYARLFNGNAFVVMITGILFQLPSGLGEGGLLGFVSKTTEGASANTTYVSGFQTALQLISVAIGLTVGLSLSLVITHPIPSKKRAGGVFSL